jgi:hypothetical protein
VVEGDTVGVAGADLTLADSAGILVARVQSDSVGFFRLPAPEPGRFRVRASRIGFSPVSAEILFREKEAVEVELRMAEEAIPLEPILVVARKRIREGTLDQFYDRMARNKQRGVGQFLTVDQIENRTQLRLDLLLQTLPGVWSRDGNVAMLNPGAAGGIFCGPEFFLDGMPMLGGYRAIELMDLEGVEAYRGYSESVDGVFPNSCGQIFLWRKDDWGNPFTWRRGFFAVGLAALAWGVASLFGWGSG